MLDDHSRGCAGSTVKKILRAAPRAREADMREAALLLQPGAALIVERALVRQQAFLPAGQEHGVELEPLGGMQGHDRDGFGAFALVGVHHQRNVFEEAARFSNSSIERTSSFRFSSRPAASARAVLLPHLGVAGFIEHDLGELGVRQRVLLRAPAVERRDKIAQRAARLRLQLLGLGERARGLQQRHAGAARAWLQRLQRGIAKPRRGVLMMRSKARSSAGWLTRRR